MTAVLIKEWRRMVRASSTPWLLLAYLLVPAAVAALYLNVSNQAPGGMQVQQMPMLGAQALNNVASWQVLLLAIAAPWLSGAMLAAEVEGRTLDPVLSGGARLFSVVLGKWLAVVSFLWLVVAAGLPAFALPLLVGGVSWTLLARVVAMELATVAALSALGLTFSAFGRRSGSTALAGLALGLTLTVGTGMAAGMAPYGVYSPDQIKMQMMLSSRIVTLNEFTAGGMMPKWLFANPLMGLGSALNNAGSSSLLGLPSIGSTPVWKHYTLWQLQAAGSAAVALMGLLAAWLTMSLRLRWRLPLWMARLMRRRKAVALNG